MLDILLLLSQLGLTLEGVSRVLLLEVLRILQQGRDGLRGLTQGILEKLGQR